MPKGKKKSKSGGGGGGSRIEQLIEEEESNFDNASVTSVGTEVPLSSDDGLGEVEPELEDGGPQIPYDDFEDKLKDAIDGTNQKSSKGRQNCLSAVHKALVSRYLYDFLVDRQITISDMLERSLKKGRGEEQGQAALLAALICIHYGPGEESESLFLSLKNILLTYLADPSILPSVRAKCATALSLCCFIVDGNCEDLPVVMEALYSVFSNSFLKGNGVPPTVTPEVAALHSAALTAWSLLVTTLSACQVARLNNTHFRKVPELLESSDLDLRIATGETLVVFYEMARLYDEHYECHDEEALVERLRTLATDCQKSRAKKDRRQQRSSFRDVIRAIEDGETPDLRIRFGSEELYISTWCRKRQYDSLCQLLGSGMNLHLAENELVRDIFELGPPLPSNVLTPKVSKFERHIANMAACKARTKSRQRLRDKRADVIR